jgi:indolepyruvate ferredoxin oxidoreductase beta subunit
LASNILAEVGLRAGHDVKKSEVHGMAQRGGAMSSHVRWGRSVLSPLIGVGEVDILVAFEQLEALRYIEMLRPHGLVLLNDHVIVPVTVTSGHERYPSQTEIVETLRQVTSQVSIVPGVAIAEQLGNPRVNNVVMLGALSAWTDVDVGLWEEVIRERVPARYQHLNMVAFTQGRQFVGGRSKSSGPAA